MTRPLKTSHPPDMQLEIGRRYELGKINGAGVLCAEFGITRPMLIKYGAAYLKAHPRTTKALTR